MQDSRIDPHQIGENFPVASKLLPERWRQPILDFYSYVRGLDNISDHPTLSREAKREQLRLIKLALKEQRFEMLPDWAQSYAQRVTNKEFSALHGDQLWQAFWQDTEKQRYRNFSEVVSYCSLSAAPVGRALLEITQQTHANLAAADALCVALQLLNHLQDAKEDYAQRERLYMPQDWLTEAGISEQVFTKNQTGPKLRGVFNQWLDETDALLRMAGNLPRTIKHRGMRWEVRVILALARGLSRKLRKSDPMAKHVTLGNLHRSLLSMGAILGLS